MESVGHPITLSPCHPVKCRLIVNPISGQGRGVPHSQRITELLSAKGWHVDLETTTKRGDALEAAKQAADAKYDRVIVAAGDGTINEAVNALVGTSTALGIVPCGTGNVLALNLGIPHDLERACAIAAGDNVHSLDVGRVEGANRIDSPRYFLLMAGVGFDAHVVHQVSAERKLRLKDYAYLVTSFEEFFQWKACDYTITIDDAATGRAETLRRRAWLAVVGNAPSYAWNIKITSLAQMNDGLLDLALFSGRNKLTHVRQVVSTLLGQHLRDEEIEYRKARAITIETDPPVPVQLDGDTVTCTPVTIEVVPQELRVIAP